MAKDKSKKVKLRPCPFCGSVPTVNRDSMLFRSKCIRNDCGDVIDVTEFRIIVKFRCPKCGMEKKVGYHGIADGDIEMDDVAQNQIARAATQNVIKNCWNERAK